MLSNAIERALSKYKSGNWDKLYLAVDLHGVVCKPTYSDKIEFYAEALWPLQQLSKSPHIVLITFTGSHPKDVAKIAKRLKEEWQIEFNYFNDNPEVVDNKLSCFYAKFYFDLLFDDKAGFVPYDWFDVVDGLKEIL